MKQVTVIQHNHTIYLDNDPSAQQTKAGVGGQNGPEPTQGLAAGIGRAVVLQHPTYRH